jgi:hypothetical protein
MFQPDYALRRIVLNVLDTNCIYLVMKYQFHEVHHDLNKTRKGLDILIM